MKTTLHHEGSAQIGAVSRNAYTCVTYFKQRVEQHQNPKDGGARNRVSIEETGEIPKS